MKIACRIKSVLFVVIIIYCLKTDKIYAQQKNLPLNHYWQTENYKYSLTNDSIFFKSELLGKQNHTAFKPQIESFGLSYNGYRYLNSIQLQNDYKPSTFIKYSGMEPWYEKLFHKSLIEINDTSDKFYLTIDPLFNFETGKDTEDSLGERVFKNTRGLLVRGDVGKNFSFESSFYENQATFPTYIKNYNETFLVVPGQGRWKKFKTHGYDYAMSSGYISYSPSIRNRNWKSNIQLGHGKHFIGDGYRSLLLSDNAFNYPYLRVTTVFKKIQYTNLYAVFMNLTNGGVTTPPNTERLFQKKAGSFQYLSWNPTKRIQVGLFQGLIWRASDNKNINHINILFANPILFGNLPAYGLRDTNNIVLGSTIKINVFKSLFVYGQYLLDDVAEKNIKGAISNKQGFQAGICYYDIMKIKNMHVQMEYNQVRPYTFAHKKTSQNYTHYNQALSHPLGANFKEFVGIFNYRIQNVFARFKINYAIVGRDSSTNYYGNSIFISDNYAFYGPESTINEQNQGIRTNITNIDFCIGYLINPATNMNIVVGVLNRKETYKDIKNNTNLIYLGFRTSLSNIYYDF